MTPLLVLLPFISFAFSQIPLDKYPGFYPHHLGIAYITNSKASYVYYINKQPLKNQIIQVMKVLPMAYSALNHLNDTFSNDTLGNRIHDIEVQIPHLKTMYDNLENEKDFTPKNRFKRGIINAGGSLSKWLFGTLDNEDGERIFNSLTMLENNQKTMQNSINKNVALYNEFINKFNQTIETINSDMKAIEIQINELNNWLHEVYSLFGYLTLDNILIRLQSNIQKLYDQLITIETSLYFSKLNIITNEVLPKQQLRLLLQKCDKQYNKAVVNFKDIHVYYQFMSLQSFINDDKILFVIHLPLIDPITYSYYHVVPIPINNQMIIPVSPYLALTQNDQLNTEEPCPKLEDFYICSPEKQIHFFRDTCIAPAILHKNPKKCNKVHVDIEDDIVKRIEDNLIIIIPKTNITIEEQCPDVITKKIDKPSIYSVPENCKTTILNRIFYGQKKEKEVRIDPLDDLNFEDIKINNNLPNIDLPKIHLNMSKIKFRNQESIQLNFERTHHTINYVIWTLVIICICSVVIYVIYKRIKVIKNRRFISDEEEAAPVRKPDIEKSLKSIFQ